MSMTKKDFIALADHIRFASHFDTIRFSQEQIYHMADFCKEQNKEFKATRWIDYINGKCGPNGGEVKDVVESNRG